MSRGRPSLAELRAAVRRGDLDLQALERDARPAVQRLVQREQRRQQKAVAERERIEAMLASEHELWSAGATRVAGVDEVGAGPWAGPVVAAAVVLPPGTSIVGIDDSKRLSARRREHLAEEIRARAVSLALGSCTPEEIDRLNIFQASRLAMQRAVQGLSSEPEHLLVDARVVPEVRMPQTALIHGDARSQSIAAASIVAKVFRDQLMEQLAEQYPGYGFERHRGYGTRLHELALARLGPCAIHRRSFAPVAAHLGPADAHAQPVA